MHLNQQLSCFKLYSAHRIILCNLISIRCSTLFQILGDFALTHEEVVERRKLLLERTQSVCVVV